MSTPTPEDPFAQPSPGSSAPVPQGGGYTSPPPPPMPGQAPPPGSFAQAGWAPAPPTGLAVLVIIATGLYTLIQLVSALMVQGTIEDTKAMLASGDTSTDLASSALQFLGFGIGVAAFVVLALWMSRIRSNLTKVGVAAGGPPHVEWWGWFVPLANFVLPLLGMRAIAHRKVGMGVLLGWWLPFCLVWLTSIAASATSVLAIDFQTGELANPDVLDASVSLTYVATVAVIVSWAFLIVIVRRVTARHLEA